MRERGGGPKHHNMSKTSITLIVLAVLAIVGLSYVAANQSPRAGAGATYYETPDFLEGLNSGGVSRLFSITRTGSTTVPAIRVDSGSYINEHSCATATFNPDAISSTTPALTSVTLTGAALGDTVMVSFASATSSELWFVSGKVTAANTITAGLYPSNSTVTSTDITTSTLRVCYFGY